MDNHKSASQNEQTATPENYSCNKCEFKSVYVKQLWDHNLNVHEAKEVIHGPPNSTNSAITLIAEQNIDILDKVSKFNKGIKGAFEQMNGDILDSVENLQKHSDNKHNEVFRALSILGEQLGFLQSKMDTVFSTLNELKSNSSLSSPTPTPKATPPSQTSEPQKPYKLPNILFVGDSIINNTKFRKIENLSKSVLKTAKAYSSLPTSTSNS